ncbi:hypothetical protein [Methanobrevibacter boviskoreani]|uniref:hypothetical protein n=1 Tax=Methanobrevibacter boviskoreani TaxID=1348249 RepID=UPI0023F498F5|nr:hypothetical protein [Methanobrevibacter boviskoreani]MDD6256345.1 hypothetical protein [Methanobrevibacter boviskoreani]
MGRKLNISDIISGTKKVKQYTIKSLDGDVYLRPLSQAEINEISEIEAAAIGTFETNEKSNNRSSRSRNIKSQLESKGKLSVLKTTQAQNQAKIKAVAYSLDNSEYEDEKFDEETLLKAPSAVIEEIYGYVQELSGLNNQNLDKDVEEFPQD